MAAGAGGWWCERGWLARLAQTACACRSPARSCLRPVGRPPPAIRCQREPLSHGSQWVSPGSWSQQCESELQL